MQYYSRNLKILAGLMCAGCGAGGAACVVPVAALGKEPLVGVQDLPKYTLFALTACAGMGILF